MKRQQRNYYAAKKQGLLKDFDKSTAFMKDYLVRRYGIDLTDLLLKEAWQEYEKIIPQIPHIEGIRARPLNAFLLITAQELAVYRVMKKHGKSPEETWEICHEAIRLRMDKYSKIKRWLFKRLLFSRFAIRRMRKRAEKHEQHRFGDFDVKYVIGDGCLYVGHSFR
jgi:hypothetical protein